MKKIILGLMIIFSCSFNANAAKVFVTNNSDYTVDVRISDNWKLSFNKHNIFAAGETRLVEIADDKVTAFKMYRSNLVAATKNAAGIATRLISVEALTTGNVVAWGYAAGSFLCKAYLNAPFAAVSIDPSENSDVDIFNVNIKNYTENENTIEAAVIALDDNFVIESLNKLNGEITPMLLSKNIDKKYILEYDNISQADPIDQIVPLTKLISKIEAKLKEKNNESSKSNSSNSDEDDIKINDLDLD